MNILGRSNDLDKDLVFDHAAKPPDHEFPKTIKKLEVDKFKREEGRILTVINLLRNFPEGMIEAPS